MINKDYCTASPDKLFGVDFRFSCAEHDADCLELWNLVWNKTISKKEYIDLRKKADLKFRDSIHSTFKKSNKKFLGWIISRIYFLGVRTYFWFSENFIKSDSF